MQKKMKDTQVAVRRITLRRQLQPMWNWSAVRVSRQMGQCSFQCYFVWWGGLTICSVWCFVEFSGKSQKNRDVPN